MLLELWLFWAKKCPQILSQSICNSRPACISMHYYSAPPPPPPHPTVSIFLHCHCSHNLPKLIGKRLYFQERRGTHHLQMYMILLHKKTKCCTLVVLKAQRGGRERAGHSGCFISAPLTNLHHVCPSVQLFIQISAMVRIYLRASRKGFQPLQVSCQVIPCGHFFCMLLSPLHHCQS